MKNKILFSALFTLVLTSFSFSSNAQARKKADKDTVEWRYEIQCQGTGVQGTYLIKVSSYSRKPQVATEQAKKNAVHGVIFKGFAGTSAGGGCTSQNALARNPNIEEEKAEFFKLFFQDGGKYMKYVTASNDGALASGDITKVSKREYKVNVVVSVKKDALRKDLENAGILKSLSSGF
jgi:hypothetical protein